MTFAICYSERDEAMAPLAVTPFFTNDSYEKPKT